MKLAMKNMKVLFKVKEFSMFWQHQKSKKTYFRKHVSAGSTDLVYQ